MSIQKAGYLLTFKNYSKIIHNDFELRSKDLNDVKIDELGQAPAYPVPSLRFVFVSPNVG